MAAIFDMLKATKGKFTADEAMAFFKTWKNPDSPRGPIAIDPETRDIIQNIYLRKSRSGMGSSSTSNSRRSRRSKTVEELNPPK